MDDQLRLIFQNLAKMERSQIRQILNMKKANSKAVNITLRQSKTRT